MSNTNKDYFTEMVKLLVGMGVIAIVVVVILRLIFGGTASNIDAADEQAVNQRLKAVETVNLVGSPAPAPVAAAPVAKSTPAVEKVEPKAVKEAAKTEGKTEDKAEPTAKSLPEAGKASVADGGSLYKSKCVACHATGVAGAPILGNKEQWAPRIAKGIDALMNTALNGSKVNPAMLPKGGAADLSDDQVKSIVEFMVSSSQ